MRAGSGHRAAIVATRYLRHSDWETGLNATLCRLAMYRQHSQPGLPQISVAADCLTLDIAPGDSSFARAGLRGDQAFVDGINYDAVNIGQLATFRINAVIERIAFEDKAVGR